VLVAACLPWAARTLAGPRGAILHVRWQPSLDPATRQQLESTFSLTNGERLEDRTWRYELSDPSSENIQSLVRHPAAEDTQAVDRVRYVLGPLAARTDRRQRLPTAGNAIVLVTDRLAVLLAACAGLLAWLGASGRAQTPQVAWLLLTGQLVAVLDAGRTSPVAKWLSRGIPDIDAETAGVFRILFGLAVVAFFASHPEGTSSLNATFNPIVEGRLHTSVLQWLRAQPSIIEILGPWLLTMGVAFTLGLFTRLTYVLFVAGALIWVFLAAVHDSTHPHSTLMLTLVALLPSRWGDALSVDAWLRRPASGVRVARRASQRYGYSVWVPGLVFGVAFAAAAWAKVVGTGPRWILNGSVKYHFITDSLNAPVDWGLQLAGHPQLAVLASLGAVAVEVLVITAAFARSDWYRLSMGAAALSLLAGFRLFMGVFWPGWWILLMGFLPWARIASVLRRARQASPHTTPHARPTIPGIATLPSAAQLAAIAFVIAQQFVISWMRIERPPMFTYYPMYSSTHASPEQFDASVTPYFRIVVSTANGRVELDCNAPDDLVSQLRAALDGATDAAARVWGEVLGCGPRLTDATDVTFEGDTRVFDWGRLTFKTERAAVVLGPLAALPR
jgi:hypothetical protein